MGVTNVDIFMFKVITLKDIYSGNFIILQKALTNQNSQKLEPSFDLNSENEVIYFI